MKEKIKKLGVSLVLIFCIVLIVTLLAGVMGGDTISIESFLYNSFIYVPVALSLFIITSVYALVAKELTDWRILSIVTAIASSDFVMQVFGFYNFNLLSLWPVSHPILHGIFLVSMALFFVEVGICVLIIKLYEKLIRRSSH